MSVKNAPRMSFVCTIVAQHEVHHVKSTPSTHDRVERIVGAVRILRDDAARLEGEALPCLQDASGDAGESDSVLRDKPQRRCRPAHDAAAHLGRPRQRYVALDGRLHKRKHVPPALEVVVREDGSAHNGQVGVRPNEVERKQVDEIEQPHEAGRVDLHGPVLGRKRDAMFVEVRIGRELKAPALAGKLDAGDAQTGLCRASGRTANALVLPAELALGE